MDKRTIVSRLYWQQVRERRMGDESAETISWNWAESRSVYYSLKAFQESPLIDSKIYSGDGRRRQKAICTEADCGELWHSKKSQHIVRGGRERYHSVWNGTAGNFKRGDVKGIQSLSYP